jgi:hypothetical protein
MTSKIYLVVAALFFLLLLTKHGIPALILLGVVWIFSVWRVVVYLRERKVQEAHQWQKIDLTGNQTKGSGRR